MRRARGPLLTAVIVLAACAEKPQPVNPPPPAGPGVVFTYPADGQLDVPVGARVVLRLSEPPAAGVIGPCTAGPVGALCIEGPGGLISSGLTVSGNTITFAPPGGLLPGATYRIHAHPSLLAGATNLPADRPLVTFRTRSEAPQANQPLQVLSVNGAPLDARDAGTAPPFLDVSPLRLLFSEPLDEATVTAQSVQLLRVNGAAEVPVAAALLAHGTHLTVDPDVDLDATSAYRLRLTSDLHDLGGDAFPGLTLELQPKRTAPAGGPLLEQDLAVVPPWQPGGTTPDSTLATMPVNTSEAVSPLIGKNVLGLLGPGLHAQLGDPSAFGGPIPMVVRKGQRLDLSPLVIRFGGVIDSGHQTGTIHLTFLSDAIGFLTRTPLRPPAQLPDDRAPVSVDLTMDAVLTADDPMGNVMSTQTMMAVRLLGTSSVDGDQLAVEQYGVLELSTLGIANAPVNMALRLRTGPFTATGLPVPTLSSVFPVDGADDFPPDSKIELNFSGPIDPGHARPQTELTLTENGVTVPFSTSVVGGVVVLQPGRRLADNSSVRVGFTGLKSLFSQAVVAVASDPTHGTGVLNFKTATLSAQSPAPPFLTAVSPGAPCAVRGLTAAAPGACEGGQTTDTSYAPFTLAANRDIHVAFSQPMDLATLTLGPSCGTGSVRVEQLSAAGLCTTQVAGTLLKSDREVRFIPNAPWVAGTTYQLTLVGGSDDTCAAVGEICSRAGKPLNTDLLTGAGDGSGGGPNVVIRFTATGATQASYLPLATWPYTDLNGNGVIDTGEVPHEENRAAMEISGTGGLITSASLNGPDCLPARPGQQSCTALHTDLPVSIGDVIDHCPIDAQGRAVTSAFPCIEVRVLPNLIINTSLSMNTTAIGFLPINDLPTGALVMRVREPGGPALGYIMHEAGLADPQFVITQQIYLDAPDLKILGGVASHDLKSKELAVTLKGPVTFLPDGRLQVAVKNLADVALSVNVAVVASGHIDLRIPAGEMHLTLVGPLLR